jgi:hypothetical protein
LLLDLAEPAVESLVFPLDIRLFIFEGFNLLSLSLS